VSNSRGHESTNRGYESVVRLMELCRSHEVPVRNITCDFKGTVFSKKIYGISYSRQRRTIIYLIFQKSNHFFRTWRIRLKAKKLSISRLIMEQYEIKY
jgi:hypothetical protein